MGSGGKKQFSQESRHKKTKLSLKAYIQIHTMALKGY